MRTRKSTRKHAAHGVRTQTECCGKESCNTGSCPHPLPWWHTKKGAK